MSIYFDPFTGKEKETPPAGIEVPAAGYFDPFTQEEATYTPQMQTPAERAEKIVKAEYGAIIEPAVKAYDVLTGKSKAPVGEKIKSLLTAPLYTVSGVMAAPVTAGLAGTGLDETFGRAFQKYVPESLQEPAAAALEIAGAAGMKGAKFTPIKGKEIKIQGVAKGIKEGQNMSAVKIAEEELMPAIMNQKAKINSEVYAPMREALKNVKTRGFVGKIAAKKIRDYANELKSKLNDNELAMLESVADDVEKWNTLDTLLDRRQAYDRKIRSLYPTGSSPKDVDFATVLALNTRKKITDTIREFIGNENPAVLRQFDEANSKFAAIMDNLEELEGAIKKDPTKFFEQGIVGSGIKRSRALTEAAGEPLVMKGAYKYLSDEVMEGGYFRASQFKKFMDKIPDEVGAEIYGPDWTEMKQLEQVINLKYNKPLSRAARKMGGVPNAALDVLVDATLQKLVTKGGTISVPYENFPYFKLEPRVLQTTLPAQTRQLTEEARK